MSIRDAEWHSCWDLGSREEIHRSLLMNCIVEDGHLVHDRRGRLLHNRRRHWPCHGVRRETAWVCSLSVRSIPRFGLLAKDPRPAHAIHPHHRQEENGDDDGEDDSKVRSGIEAMPPDAGVGTAVILSWLFSLGRLHSCGYIWRNTPIQSRMSSAPDKQRMGFDDA